MPESKVGQLEGPGRHSDCHKEEGGGAKIKLRDWVSRLKGWREQEGCEQSDGTHWILVDA